MVSGAEHPPATAGPLGTAGALIGSAALFYAGTGLHPVWWLTWLAPLPVLLLAPRASARRTALVAALAHLLGMTNVALYLSVVGLPAPLIAGAYLLTAGVFAGMVLLFRALLRRGLVLLAVLAGPALWAGAEYLVAVLTPLGSNWSIANTQFDFRPVLQLVSLTGPWGIAFVLFVAAAAVAALLCPAASAAARVRAAVAGALVLGAAVGYGTVRLAPATTGSVRVSLVAVPAQLEPPKAGAAPGQALLAADLDWVRSMPVGAAQLVVFPEKDLVVDDVTLPGVIGQVASTAKDRRVTLVLGVTQHTGSTLYNTALAFPPDGSAPVAYHKQYPIPGGERGFTPGGAAAFVHGFDGRVGVAICADLGQVSLGRDYAHAGAGLLAVPALDFDVDARAQSRVQLMRGVENGFSVARAARRGYLTLSDGRGRVLAQASTASDQVVTVTADLPVSGAGTPYTRYGDWFAWLCLALTTLALATAMRQQPPREHSPASG